MDITSNFQLYHWIFSNASTARAILASSDTPALSLNDIIALSSDPTATTAAFNFVSQRLGLGSAQGAEPLRSALAATYTAQKSKIDASNVIIANGTSGANHIIYRSLLQSNDHVIVQYPTYGPLIEEPLHIGCDLSFWRLRAERNWELDLDELKRLIKPGVTRMLILNNPNNPTGTHLPTAFQREIVELAKQYDLIVHCDEIFRPLFHNADTAYLTSISNGANGTNASDTVSDTASAKDIPTSLIEHADTIGYDKLIVTSSLSKCYGLSGVRIGWILTRDKEILAKMMHYRLFSMQSASVIDELIATEVLGPRCRPAILQKHLSIARTNLDLIQRFVDEHREQCEWVRPTAASTAFVKFKDAATGHPVDDVQFGKELMERKGLLISPASMCFSFDEGMGKKGEEWREEFKGRVRFHFTTRTEIVQLGLKLLGEFLDEEKIKTGVQKL